MGRQSQRNFYVLLADAVAYAVFFTFWDVNTVIPVFLDCAGCPSWLIGVANTIKQLGYLLPQLVMTALLYKVHSMVRFIRAVMFIDRPQLLLFSSLLLLTGNKTALILFFVSFTIFCFGEGIILIPWMDLLGRTVRPGHRGRLWGTVQVCGGLAALGTGFIISRIINHPDYPYPLNFFLIFSLGALILLPSLLLFKMAADPPLRNVAARPKWKSSVILCLVNKKFILLLVVQLLVSADALALPYYIIMARHKFAELSPSIGIYIFLNICGAVLGGVLWGFFGGRGRNRQAIVLVALVKVFAAGGFLIAQLMPGKTTVSFLLAPAFVLAGMASGAWLGFINYILDLSGDHNRIFFIAVNNVALLPVSLLPLIGGIVRGYAGDTALFAVTTLLAICGFALSFRLKEPYERC